MTATRSAKLFGQTGALRPTAPPTTPELPPTPPRGLILALRALSVAVGYGAMRLAAWALQSEAPSHGSALFALGVTAGAVCMAMAWLGTMASPKAVEKVWKAIGKVVLGLLMFT